MVKIIKVIFSGSGSTQTNPFTEAVSDLINEGKIIKFDNDRNDNPEDAVKIVKATLPQFVKLGLTSEQFIEWAASSYATIWLSHPLQCDIPPDWNKQEHLQKLADRLKNHNVYPKNLLAGAFTQDKWDYYDRLQDIMNPSLKVDTPVNGKLSKEALGEIFRFTQAHPGELHEGHYGGYYVKTPFQTGGKGVNSCRKATEIPSTVLALLKRDFFEEVPYAFVNEAMDTSKEIKISFLSNPYTGEELDCFLAFNPKKGHGRSFSDVPSLIEFAKLARRRYMEAYGNESVYPLLRVDIFMRQDGRLVVNEFEHLEAQIVPGGHDVNVTDPKYITFLKNFWKDQIMHMLYEFK